MTHNIDISREFMICRYLNGIKLISREELLSTHTKKLYVEPVATVADIMQARFNVFFTINSVIKELNDACLESVCADSKSKVVEYPYSKLMCDPMQTQKIMANDSWVMKQKNQKMFEEEVELIDAGAIHVVSLKAPWYENKGQLVGVFGCSVVVHAQNFTETLQQIIALSNLFMFSKDSIRYALLGKEIKGEYFSAREIDIIQHVFQGKTLREIAEILVLSPRTVESYFENIKAKAGVRTKSQLIQYVHAMVFQKH